MFRAVAVAFLLFAAAPLLAQRRVDLIVDAEGVRRSSDTTIPFVPNTLSYQPRFDTGGGLGFGVDWFLSDHASAEAKVAGLVTRMRVRVTGSDFVATSDLGRAQIY